MQLSLLYAATVFAAAWASPVPNPANQAIATQPLSERAAVPYHADALQATPFSITNWHHNNHIEYYRMGGTGGDPFSDLPTLESFEVAPTITQFVALTGNSVNHVKLSGCVGVPCVKYDAPHGHDAQSLSNPVNTMDVHLDLADGEWLEYVELQTEAGTGGVDDPDLVYIKVGTNFKNWVEAGRTSLNNVVKVFTAPEGYTRVVGFHGTGGDWVDSLAPIWA